jgi:toxin ParE1/3/4
MAFFVLRPLAQEDLAQTYSYILQTSLEQAELWLERVENQCQILAEMPTMGRTRPELPGHVRSFVFARYVIFYRPNADGVEIVRVLHGSRDLGQIDFGNS